MLARLFVLAIVVSCAVLAWRAPAAADDRTRITILEENDSLYFDRDKHYTQGLRLSYLAPDLSPESGWNRPFDLLGAVVPIFPRDAADRTRRYAVLLGQSIFTPTNLKLRERQQGDRPYAGWLYTGVSLLQETDGHVLDNVELDLGVVGPAAIGEEVQNHWHQFIGTGLAKGWRNEIHDEPGGVLSYARLWRVPLVGRENGIDVVPEAGATVGNVFTYGEAGALLRVGKNLRVDYGPARIRPALSGTDYVDGGCLARTFGFYVFVGAQGRVIARNIFLDGNSFRPSPSVHKKPLVADLQAGVSIFWGTALRLDASVVERTEEFHGQHGPDEVGTVTLSFSW